MVKIPFIDFYNPSRTAKIYHMTNRHNISEARVSPPQPTEQAMSLNREGIALASANKLDEAIAVLKKAQLLNPRLTSTLHNLGAVHMLKGDMAEAAICYRRLIESEPNSPKSHFNLANIYRNLGNRQDAIKHLRQVIALAPNHHSASHLLATCTGETPDRAPASFVAELFDQYSSTFEQVLTGELAYKTPTALCSMLVEEAVFSLPFANALDIGCGTGLAGVAFMDHCQRFTGVDLSQKMLDQCIKKGIYQSLINADVVDFMNTTTERFDVFIAADAFIYFGDLAPVFSGIKRCAGPNAYVIFSTEAMEGEGFRLTPTGRFTHSTDYVERVISDLRMQLVASRSEVIRKEQNTDVQGDLFLVSVKKLAQ